LLRQLLPQEVTLMSPWLRLHAPVTTQMTVTLDSTAMTMMMTMNSILRCLYDVVGWFVFSCGSKWSAFQIQIGWDSRSCDPNTLEVDVAS
jgi:hypothetical protein